MKRYMISIAYGSKELGKNDVGTACGAIIIEVPGERIDIKSFELKDDECLDMELNKLYDRESMLKLGYIPEPIAL